MNLSALMSMFLMALSLQVLAAPKTNCTEGQIIDVVYEVNITKETRAGACDVVVSKDQSSGELKGVYCMGTDTEPGYLDELNFADGRLTGKWHVGETWGFVDLWYSNECTNIYGLGTWAGGGGSWMGHRKAR